jgi:phenylpyruvate tautomerase PptA (4-oxalocrotonate tautomerase family)
LSISSGGNLLYIPVERETLFRVSLAVRVHTIADFNKRQCADTQVIFIEVKHSNYFVGSVPPDSDQISVEGRLRTGRSLLEAKRSLVERIVEAVALAAAMPKSHVWAHLVDMPATQIVEFGHVVPSWCAVLSDEP